MSQPNPGGSNSSKKPTLEEMLQQYEMEGLEEGKVDYGFFFEDDPTGGNATIAALLEGEDELFEEEDDEEMTEEEKLFWAKETKKQQRISQNKRSHGHATLKRQNYDDLNLYSDDNVLLAKIDQRKFDWYLKKGLGEKINESSIRLLFRPKGYGHKDDQFYLSKIENICVSCGSDQNLTRHHIVAFEYRKQMPEFVRSHSSHDVCLLCAACHEIYETRAFKLRKELAERYESPLGGVGIIKNLQVASAKKAANALLKNRDKIPPNRVEALENELRLFLKSMNLTEDNTVSDNTEDDEISEEQMISVLNLQATDTNSFVSHGEGVINAIKKISTSDDDYMNRLDDFCVMWRQHFVDSLKPQHMPKHWKVDKKIRKGELDDNNKIIEGISNR